MGRIYSDLKILSHPDRLQALRRGEPAAPVHVRIKPINRCNHNCWYCAYRADNLKLGEDMDEGDRIPEPKMVEIAQDLVRMGVRAATFSGGGEPLLYKPLPRIVELLAKGGVQVAALTNGANLQARMADAFAEYGTWVRVSVDGYDDASYNESRGLKGPRFSALLDNIARFAARRSACTLGISFIVGERNAAHLYDVCKLFHDLGVNHVKLSGVVVGNSVAENNAYHARIGGLVSEQIARARELTDDSFTVIDHYHGLDELFVKPYQTCPILNFLTVIGADCRVYTCQDKAYTDLGCLGSIDERSFAEFWFSDENQETLRCFNPAERCAHHCVAHRKNLALTELLTTDPAHAAFV